MVYVGLPTGDNGPGVRGDNLARALAALTPTKRLQNGAERPNAVPGPLLQMANHWFRPREGLTALRHVGYAVFENDVTAYRAARAARGVLSSFDVIATTSRWCEQVLRDAGLTSVTTIHCGVDRSRFQPARAIRRRFRDRFVVFSGGKFELRKAQDVVVHAFKIFVDRHPDALLLAVWNNPSFPSTKTMKASPYYPLTFEVLDKTTDDRLPRWLNATGLNPQHIQFVSMRPHSDMPAIYGDTDVGLFPNRCEGDTNLIMMEYMACGRPVIATDFSGHRDLLTDANSFCLRSWRPAPFRRYGEVEGCWCEPNIDEIVACLERAYSDRDHLAALSQRAHADLSKWTWERTARQFLDILWHSSVTARTCDGPPAASVPSTLG